MAGRVTQEEVRVIWEPPSAIDDIDFDAYIDQATRFVDAHLLGVGLAAAQLKDIELYIVPYFANTQKPQPLSASVLNTSQTRTGLFAFAGLLGDPYGQRAVELDTSNTLLELAKRMQAASRGKGDAINEVGFLGISDANQDLLT